MHIPVDARPRLQIRIDVREKVGREDGRGEGLDGLVENKREDYFVDMIW